MPKATTTASLKKHLNNQPYLTSKEQEQKAKLEEKDKEQLAVFKEVSQRLGNRAGRRAGITEVSEQTPAATQYNSEASSMLSTRASSPVLFSIIPLDDALAEDCAELLQLKK